MTTTQNDGPHPPLPAPAGNQVYVRVAALNGGSVTFPETIFIADPDPHKKTTVPSMCFWIEHVDAATGKLDRLVFDLGTKRDLSKPISCTTDVRFSLLNGGLRPEKGIDYVIISQVDWDHIGVLFRLPELQDHRRIGKLSTS